MLSRGFGWICSLQLLNRFSASNSRNLKDPVLRGFSNPEKKIRETVGVGGRREDALEIKKGYALKIVSGSD